MNDFLAIAYLLVCGVGAAMAYGTGRSPVLWFMICLLMTPLLGLPILGLISQRQGN